MRIYVPLLLKQGENSQHYGLGQLLENLVYSTAEQDGRKKQACSTVICKCKKNDYIVIRGDMSGRTMNIPINNIMETMVKM